MLHDELRIGSRDLSCALQCNVIAAEFRLRTRGSLHRAPVQLCQVDAVPWIAGGLAGGLGAAPFPVGSAASIGRKQSTQFLLTLRQVPTPEPALRPAHHTATGVSVSCSCSFASISPVREVPTASNLAIVGICASRRIDGIRSSLREQPSVDSINRSTCVTWPPAAERFRRPEPPSTAVLTTTHHRPTADQRLLLPPANETRRPHRCRDHASTSNCLSCSVACSRPATAPDLGRLPSSHNCRVPVLCRPSPPDPRNALLRAGRKHGTRLAVLGRCAPRQCRRVRLSPSQG
jgi:hypothetical protein